ncbi:MAG: dTDP-4-dehydrorhamnose 3,5-epimerase [Pseudomonadota bacterium]
MKAMETAIPGVLLLEPKVFGDERGFFVESYNEKTFQAATGQTPHFVQDNHSRSSRGVLRGLHYQIRQPQGKLVRVTHGAVLDVAVDLRRSSPAFGRWVSVELSAENFHQLWVPAGCAHGFLVLSASADMVYKTTDFYLPDAECSLAWDDPDVGIEWPIEANTSPVLSAKDKLGCALANAPTFP